MRDMIISMSRMQCILVIFFMISIKAYCFDKVIIWGHKLHSHTHSYIHNGFYTAFKYLGYQTYWFDDKDDVTRFDFANSLFITEGQADHNIPLRHDCKYILHNCVDPKYRSLKQENYILLQVYTDSIFQVRSLVKLASCIYYDLVGRCLYMPWATDLLPWEIEEIQRHLATTPIQKRVAWVGTVGAGKFGNIEQLQPFIQACEENMIDFFSKRGVSAEDHCEIIRTSYIAPAIVGEWQQNCGYIPCRIFKNISYGKMGVTNSPRVYELFEGKIVYNPDSYQLFYDAKKKVDAMSSEELLNLMDFVKTKHTYLNRIVTLLDFLDLVEVTYAHRE